ncbi:unnamed protein product [Linum tenue]|uniref:PX domain-containing protein n=2 Tax=Linum tenue TaxID=586396 RepID=A0AAV0MDD9_9ROSI|nr:unnamed protein product [Linum tenue]
MHCINFFAKLYVLSTIPVHLGMYDEYFILVLNFIRVNDQMGQFYRVQVGLQSPEGVTVTRGVLRRFNDFLRLFADLKKAFPKKSLPPAPPKGLLRMKSRALLEERRCSLEEWLTKLLSDIDLSRSIAAASFLELEVAARSAFQDAYQESSETALTDDATPTSSQILPNSSLSALTATSSVASDYGSDTAYEASEIGTPRLGKDESSEIGMEDLALDEDLANPIEKLVKYGMSNIDEGFLMGHTILDQLEGFPRHKPHTRHANNVLGNSMYNGNASKVQTLVGNGVDLFSEPEHCRAALGHARKLSSESFGSDGSSLRSSENAGISNSITADVSLDIARGAEVSSSSGILSKIESQLSGNTQIIIPFDQRHKMSRVLTALQRRLGTVKTDMEDLISRLNQERAIKDYLAKKVKDLEVELETSKQKNKENLQQAILVERERLTQMQWDMEELRRKAFEMELKLKAKEDEKSSMSLEDGPTNQQKDAALEELDITKKKLEDLTKQYEVLEVKSKAELKFLAKEFKSLQSSQKQLKEERDRAMNEKSDIEKHLEREREIGEDEKDLQKRLLHDCRTVWSRLQECNLNLSTEDDDNNFVPNSSSEDMFDLLKTFDDRISLLLAEAQLLADDGGADRNVKTTSNIELSTLLVDILADNAKLRKQVYSVTRRALRNGTISREPPLNISNVDR